ncbi:MAG: 50S ribosomal protein L31e [Methanobrevibacter boviskoreani]|jgi:large subunit ribosomal protein L31e|uniref:50S ribosomal protein L31e n=1 Tax=Methanobrevibacter TaxID=2172 RepID=UPI0003348C75|nr:MULTISPECIES: 50S ribosomal protein L31e [Methanobrevibacter]AGN16116.1 ribosomal protein L31e Rpl31e [Methanobrevibacter sp. AbM4]MCI6775685.1 50S ribosomal protein L31e [Methanobrevibacter boviskoreani]MCI6931148.1 50S ribosomal protein L31e [Methanobrevibacter boviskoreani]MDD6256248.1 50S ribosomal protein L31e [Methanobrevibacter boviskoreani]MDY5615244.1 50S ribosomal protein L31e [Methanobrevibacter boviskoreani]
MAEDLERVYTIPLRNVKNVKRTIRAPRAIREVKNFLMKHMKVEDVVIDSSINEKIWERGIQKIPSKIKVKATLVEEDDERYVKAELAE